MVKSHYCKDTSSSLLTWLPIFDFNLKTNCLYHHFNIIYEVKCTPYACQLSLKLVYSDELFSQQFPYANFAKCIMKII